MGVDATNYAHVTEAACSWAREASSRSICFATVNNVMEAYDSAEFRRVMNGADLVTPDGMPLVWSLRLLGHPDATRVYGPDLTLFLLKRAERERLSVGFYGGSPEVLARLVRVVERDYPQTRIVYAYSPPFRPLSPEEDERVVQEINASRTSILFIGLNTPKQDFWMAAHRGRVRSVMLGVGAAFDFIAGSKRQAPRWMMRCGLEWAFRFFTEPRRLARRYLKHNPRFVALFLLQLLRSSVRGCVQNGRS